MGAQFGKRRYVFQIFGQEEKLLPRAQSGRKNLGSAHNFGALLRLDPIPEEKIIQRA